MKGIKKLLKNNIKLIIGLIIGIIISGTTIYGATILFDGDQVSYDATTSGLKKNGVTVTNVQDALDALNTAAQSCASTSTYYAFGNPTTASTTDYTTLNSNVFVALNGTQKSVCIIRNSKLHCFDNNNYEYEKWHIQGVFNDISCSVGPFASYDYATCSNSGLSCSIRSDGWVSCNDNSADLHCVVRTDDLGMCWYGSE